jgi:hypothetical protein
MKQAFILFAGLTTAMFSSCTKSPVTNTWNSKPEFNKVAQQLGGATQVYVENIRNCTIPASNCGPTTTIKSTHLAAIRNAIQGGPTAVAGFFNNSQNSSVEFYPMIDQTVLTNLQSGSYTLLEVASLDPNAPNIRCFLIGPAQTLSTTSYDYVMAIDPI